MDIIEKTRKKYLENAVIIERKTLRHLKTGRREATQAAYDYHLCAVEKVKNKDIQGAIYCYDQSLILDPENALYFFLRGQLKTGNDDPGAIDDYSKAIELNSKDPRFYHDRGFILHKQGNIKGAIKDYTKALKLDPDNVAYIVTIGNLKRKLGDKKGALKDYETAIKLSEDNANLHILKGDICLDKKDFSQAIECYQKALLLDPENKDILQKMTIAKEKNSSQ